MKKKICILTIQLNILLTYSTRIYKYLIASWLKDDSDTNSLMVHGTMVLRAYSTNSLEHRQFLTLNGQCLGRLKYRVFMIMVKSLLYRASLLMICPRATQCYFQLAET